jgi:hypothetical protein
MVESDYLHRDRVGNDEAVVLDRLQVCSISRCAGGVAPMRRNAKGPAAVSGGRREPRRLVATEFESACAGCDPRDGMQVVAYDERWPGNGSMTHRGFVLKL